MNDVVFGILLVCGIFYPLIMLAMIFGMMQDESAWEDGKMNRRIALAIIWPIAFIVWTCHGLAALKRDGIDDLGL